MFGIDFGSKRIKLMQIRDGQRKKPEAYDCTLKAFFINCKRRFISWSELFKIKRWFWMRGGQGNYCETYDCTVNNNLPQSNEADGTMFYF